MAKDRSLVRASDIGAWAYCRRAWWLATVCKTPHADPARLEQGTAGHHRHGRQVRRSVLWRRTGMLLIVFAVTLVVVLLILMELQ